MQGSDHSRILALRLISAEGFLGVLGDPTQYDLQLSSRGMGEDHGKTGQMAAIATKAALAVSLQ